MSAEEFLEWASPYVAAIQGLSAAIDSTRDRHGDLPSPDSEAMVEIAEEQGYRTRSEWNQPLTDTHMLGARTLQAATDYVRGLADLFEHGRPPLYAHLTLARAALEASVVSAWLSEPRISVLDRIKRGLCEFLYSAREVKELELSPDAADKVRWWDGVAESFGWEVEGARGRPKVGGVRRPRIGTEISRLGGGRSLSSPVRRFVFEISERRPPSAC